jgi:hypothetical protein
MEDIKEKQRAKSKLYYEKNKEKVKERTNKYYHETKEDNKEQRKAYDKKRIAENQEKVSETCKLFYYSNSGIYSRYKREAKRRKYDFEMTKEDFESYYQQPCGYCGDIVSTIGIDRIDNNKGYITGNVVSCCSVCNIMKNKHSIPFLLSHIEKILNKGNIRYA